MNEEEFDDISESDLESLLEDIAAIEHDQWIEWSKNIVQKESLSKERIERWSKLWVPYAQLTEEQKEQDRIWARKVMAIIV